VPRRGEPSHTPSVVYRPHSPPYASPEGAKPPRTPVVVLRPLFSSGVLRKRGRCSPTHRRTRGRSIRLPLRKPRVSLRVHPRSFIAPHLLPLGEPGGAASAYPYANQGRAFSYIRHRIAPPIFLGCAAEKGRSIRLPSREQARVEEPSRRASR
jgi:hypothetical protein